MATRKAQTPKPSDELASEASAPREADGNASGPDLGGANFGGANFGNANFGGAINATAVLTPTPAPAPPEKKASSGKKVAVERRRSPREQHIAPAVLQPPSGDAAPEASHGVTVQDLSLGGVGFRGTDKFEPGETYRITLGKGPLLLNARIRIVSCRQVGHRMYHVGAEFC